MEIEASVPEFKKIFEGSKDVVYFTIKLKYGSHQWSLDKRFSDITQLHEDLSKNHGNLPQLPAKTLFPLKKYEDIDARRVKLDNYMQVSLKGII